MQKLKVVGPISWLFAAVMMVALGGCNGVVSDATTVEKTIPSVASITPANGAVGVLVGAAVTVTFSEAMDAASLTTSTFTISGVTGTVTYDAATNIATFTPSSALAYNTAYTVTITTAAADKFTNPIAANYTWSFETEKIGRFAFVTGSDGTIPGFGVKNPSVDLRPLNYMAPTAVGSGQYYTTAHPTGKFLYRANFTSGTTVSAFSVDQTNGRLTEITGSPFTTGTAPYRVVVDPTGKFAYVGNYAGGAGTAVSGFAIDASTGALTPLAGSPFTVATGVLSLTIDPAGRYLYTTNYGTGTGTTVSAYAIDATTGGLTAVTGSPFTTGGTGPFSAAVDPTGKYLIVTHTVGASNVAVLSINAATGALTAVTGSPFTAGTLPVDVAIDSTGKYAYVSNTTSSNISGFSIAAATGALTPVPNSPFTAGSQPWGLTIDPTNKDLYVTNSSSSSSSVFAYTIDAATGELTKKAEMRTRPGRSMVFTNGTAPLTFGATYAYAANSTSPASVSAYSMASGTGLLTALASSPVAFSAPSALPYGASADPFGRFYYTANQNASVSGFSINATTGDLTSVSGAPFAVAGALWGIANDPYGRFVYATNASTGVYGFVVDQTTGALTAASGSPVTAATVTSASWLSVDPSGRFAFVSNANSTTGSVTPFSIDQSSGALTEGVAATTGGAFTYTAVVDPTGRFVFAPNWSSDSISKFSVNVTTGALTAIGTPIVVSGTSPRPLAVAVHPSGMYLYSANYGAGSGTVSAFTINASSGEIAEIAGSTLAAGVQPWSVKVSPSGEYLYVSSAGGSNTVLMFSINATTGALTALSPATIATQANPYSLVVTQPVQ